MSIKFKLTAKAKLLQELEEISFIPKQAHGSDAGYDLSACLNIPLKVFPGEVVKIPLGVHVWLGDSMARDSSGLWSWAALYLPRSSCPSLKLTNTIGLLDADYQGESFAKYENTGDETVVINPGDRIIQLVIIKAFTGGMKEVEDFETVTARGESGFGGSGR